MKKTFKTLVGVATLIGVISVASTEFSTVEVKSHLTERSKRKGYGDGDDLTIPDKTDIDETIAEELSVLLGIKKQEIIKGFRQGKLPEYYVKASGKDKEELEKQLLFLLQDKMKNKIKSDISEGVLSEEKGLALLEKIEKRRNNM